MNLVDKPVLARFNDGEAISLTRSFFYNLGHIRKPGLQVINDEDLTDADKSLALLVLFHVRCVARCAVEVGWSQSTAEAYYLIASDDQFGLKPGVNDYFSAALGTCFNHVEYDGKFVIVRTVPERLAGLTPLQIAQAAAAALLGMPLKLLQSLNRSDDYDADDDE